MHIPLSLRTCWRLCGPVAELFRSFDLVFYYNREKLLASCLMHRGIRLWAHDRRLSTQVERLGITCQSHR